MQKMQHLHDSMVDAEPLPRHHKWQKALLRITGLCRFKLQRQGLPCLQTSQPLRSYT